MTVIGADSVIVGFFLSGTIYYTLCKIFPLERVDEKDEHDYFGTFGYVRAPVSHLPSPDISLHTSTR